MSLRDPYAIPLKARSRGISIPGDVDNVIMIWMDEYGKKHAFAIAEGSLKKPHRGMIIAEMVSRLNHIGWKPGLDVILAPASHTAAAQAAFSTKTKKRALANTSHRHH